MKYQTREGYRILTNDCSMLFISRIKKSYMLSWKQEDCCLRYREKRSILHEEKSIIRDNWMLELYIKDTIVESRVCYIKLRIKKTHRWKFIKRFVGTNSKNLYYSFRDISYKCRQEGSLQLEENR